MLERSVCEELRETRERKKGGGALRVIGGCLRSRRLVSPTGARPTSDRVREALFERLPDLEGALVLDLYAGSGALGIEALSRGAAHAVFVERASRALGVLRRNLVSLDLVASARVVKGDALKALHGLARESQRFDMILVDPPYDSGEVDRCLPAIASSDLLAAGAMLVVERPKRHSLFPIAELEVLDERRYGDTLITRLVARPGRGLRGGVAPDAVKDVPRDDG